MTLKFSENGHYISDKPSAVKYLASTGYTTVDTPIESLPETPFSFEVGIGVTKGLWGRSNKEGVKVDAKEIATNIAQFARAFPNQIPLEESIMDGFSSTSVHELIHQVGKLPHKDKWHRKQTRKIDEFYAIESMMGHPIKSKMHEALGEKLDVQHEIMCIDLPEVEPEIERPTPPSPPTPKPAFESVTIGNMVLKVRKD